MDIIIILFLALLIDLALGEPPHPIHPVVGMGKVIAFLERGGHNRPPAYQFVWGLGMVVITVGVFTASAYFILLYIKSLNFAAFVIVGAWLLKSTFSLKGLRQAALRVKQLLLADKLDEARFELRALVGRDTKNLPKPLLVSATVESVAESTGDGIIAPLFYFLLLGVPGAIAYRAVNTMDSMVGYHGKYEYLGKFAAGLDNILNFIPARLAALLLVLATFLSGRDVRASWQIALSEHAKTRSHNSGWPMAAIAGALNVQLEKLGYHQLGKANAPLVPETIDASLSLMQIATLAWVILCFSAGVIHVLTA